MEDGVHGLQDGYGVVAVLFHDLDGFTLQVCTQLIEDWSTSRAFRVGFAVQRALRFFGGGKEFLREVPLSGIEHVQYGYSAFNETLIHAAIFSQSDHEERWFKRCL